MHRTRLTRATLVLAALSIPAFAQVDLSGAWQPVPAEESLGNPDLVDYTGLPINEAARQWALSWDPDRLGLSEHQCQVHTAALYLRRPPPASRLGRERSTNAGSGRHPKLHQHL